MDYLDGALSPDEKARVEQHLASHAEDAELMHDLKMALGAAKEWHESEPLQVGQNFWPALRDNLGPAPKRSAWSKLRNQMAGAFSPSPATRISMGAALAAVVLAMSAFLFAPQNASKPAVADLSAADKMFIQQSVEKHEVYVQSAPLPGDASTFETGEDDENEPEIP